MLMILVKVLILQCYFGELSSMQPVPSYWLPGRVSMVWAILQEKETRNMYQCENLCKVTSPCQSVSYSVRTRVCSLFRGVPSDGEISLSTSDLRISDIQKLPKGMCNRQCEDDHVCAFTGSETICLLAGGYLGCYTDDGARMLNNSFLADTNMTWEKCFQFCEGYNYAGLEFSTECYCGNNFDPDRYKRMPETECSAPCAGNPGQICGADWRSSVFRLKTHITQT